ncbi:hypothetical protein [Oceanospirillum sediminis]|uniref:General secretion pathway protein N n=1 Tax=Oceanospirillum sediminis TaxID=2760088 RepID=A0A839IKI4_9GAMM|nr:hypothetical protein [Oceanospirillum sediminis]MBB1485863.1 hypothetical protein [Oceanospirillum sediminis]
MTLDSGKVRQQLVRIFLLIFMLGLLINLPVRAVWPYLEKQLSLPESLNISLLNGSVWQGDALIRYQYDNLQPEFRVWWQFSLIQWFRTGYPVQLTLKHPGTSLVARISPEGSESIRLRLEGILHPLLLNPFLKKHNAWIEGDIAFRNVSLILGQRAVKDTSGAITWQGGETWFLGNNKPVKIPYPPLALRFNSDPQASRADLTTQDSDDALAIIELNNDGWLSASILGRLKKSVPALPVPRRADDDALFRYKEKIW